MKIAHLLWSLGTGGVENMIVDISNEQVKTEQVQLFIVNNICDKSVLDRIDSRIKVYKCDRNLGSRSPIPLIRLNYALWKYKPDILHLHLDSQSKLVWLPYKMVRTIHNTHSSFADIRRFRKLFCISKGVKHYTATQGYPNGIVVYNGIHRENISCQPKGVFAGDVRKHFICVGRLHEDKGQGVLVEAVNELVNNSHITAFCIDLIGDGPLRQELEGKVRKYGLSDYIHFLGLQPREYFYSRLCEYDLFILPSVSEGFGLTLAEACAAKIPILSSDLEGPIEVIDGGRLGWTFNTGDAFNLADQLEKFLAGGYNQELVDEAYQFVSKNFDVKVTAVKYIEEYNHLCNE